jgi:hypothetical protein
MPIFSLITAAVISVVFVREAEAQRRFEAGIQITGVHLHKLHETPYGIGARILFDLNAASAVEAEIVHYPENSSGEFGETALLIGSKNGWRFRRFGIFGKGRLGTMHFGGDFYRSRLDKKTFMMADIGGVIEYSASERWVLRIDAGDTILFYGSHALFRGPNSPPLGTVHNFQPAFGIAFRF